MTKLIKPRYIIIIVSSLLLMSFLMFGSVVELLSINLDDKFIEENIKTLIEDKNHKLIQNFLLQGRCMWISSGPVRKILIIEEENFNKFVDSNPEGKEEDPISTNFLNFNDEEKLSHNYYESDIDFNKILDIKTKKIFKVPYFQTSFTSIRSVTKKFLEKMQEHCARFKNDRYFMLWTLSSLNDRLFFRVSWITIDFKTIYLMKYEAMLSKNINELSTLHIGALLVHLIFKAQSANTEDNNL